MAEYVRDEELFCFPYWNGLADINLSNEIDFHRCCGKAATITAVQPLGLVGALQVHEGRGHGFTEKPRGDGAVNGGVLVLSPTCLYFIEDDATVWEGTPLTTPAEWGELVDFVQLGCWQPMDTLRDRKYMEEPLASRKAPWKIW